MIQRTTTRHATFAALALGLLAATCSGPTNVVVAPDSDNAIPDTLRTQYHEDAAILTLRQVALSQDLAQANPEIPAEPDSALYHALVHIYNAGGLPARDTIVDAYAIHAAPTPETRELLVHFDDSASWTNAWQNDSTLTGYEPVDTLLQQYGLVLDSIYNLSIGQFALLRADDRPLNIAGLVRLFEAIPGITYAEPNTHTSDNDIDADSVDTDWLLRFTHGFGDCSAGCTSHHWWLFDVGEDGRVRFVGSGGAALP